MRKPTLALSSVLFVATLILVGCTKPSWFAKNFTDITTNYVDVLVTNATGEVVLAKKPIYTYGKNQETDTSLREGARVVGGFWGLGGPAAAIIGTIYGGIVTVMNMRNKKANISLTQGTEVALELFKSISPILESKFKASLIKEQEASGTKGTIKAIVDTHVDEHGATAEAADIVSKASAPPVPPTTNSPFVVPPPAPVR